MSATDTADVQGHFAARAATYDGSSFWCTDPVIAQMTIDLLDAGPTDHVLDVACGTGLVSKLFHGRVGKLTGLDLTAEMAELGRPFLDELVLGSAHEMPFDDGTFDRVVCRQGIQFMNDARALSEMFRVLKPGGRVLIVNLCAYGEDDRIEYYEILRLRNPARCNFYLRSDLSALLSGVGFDPVVIHDHVSVEDVDVWSANGAISEQRREGIRSVYRHASTEFSELHAAQVSDDRIVDHMLFGMAVGVKSSG
jgi:DNA gyrase subunit B